MFQHKTDRIFKELYNVFGIADAISVVGYDTHGRYHDRTLRQVMQLCPKENLMLNKSAASDVQGSPSLLRLNQDMGCS